MNSQTQKPMTTTVLTHFKRAPTLNEILQVTADLFAMAPALLLSRTNMQDVVAARQMAMLISRELTRKSYKAIARTYQKDHSTVVYSVARAKARVETDEIYARLYEAIYARLLQKCDKPPTASMKSTDPRPTRANRLLRIEMLLGEVLAELRAKPAQAL